MPAQLVSTSQSSIANASSHTVAKPTGLQANDIMVARFVVRNTTARTYTAPAGWTPVGAAKNYSTTLQTSEWFWKKADAADVAASSFTFSLTSANTTIVFIVAVRGAHQTDPLPLAAQADSTYSSSVNPQTTPTVAQKAGGLNVGLWSTSRGNTWSNYTGGMVQALHGTAGTNTGLAAAVATVEAVTTGTSPTYSATVASTSVFCANLANIAPAAAEVAPTTPAAPVASVVDHETVSVDHDTTTGGATHDIRVNGSTIFTSVADPFLHAATPSTTYSYESRAVNSQGTTTWSPVSNTVTTPAAPQYLRPVAEGIVGGTWTTVGAADAPAALADESDGSYIETPTNPDATVFHTSVLTDATPPSTDTPVTMRVRAAKVGGARTIELTAEVRQGDGTVVASLVMGTLPADVPTDFEYQLTPAEVASITDWTDVRIRANPSTSGGGSGSSGRIYRVELQVPAGTVREPVNLSVSAAGGSASQGTAGIRRTVTASASGQSTSAGTAAGVISRAASASGASASTGTAVVRRTGAVAASGRSSTAGTGTIRRSTTVAASGSSGTAGTGATIGAAPITASASTASAGSAAITVQVGTVEHVAAASGLATTAGTAAVTSSTLVAGSGVSTTAGSAFAPVAGVVAASGSTTTAGSVAVFALLAVTGSAVSTSAGTAVTTIISKPGPPLNPVAKAGDAQVTYSFSPPADDGGLPITSYVKQYREVV